MSYEDLRVRMKEAGVDRAILVPPSFAGAYPEFSLEAAAGDAEQFAVMGSVPLNKPEGPRVLEALMSQPGALGVRLTFHHEYDESWIRDGTADWFWPMAEKMNIPVMMNAPSIHNDVAGVAERHPGLRLILDHMARVKGMKDDKLGVGLAPTIGLAKYPNIFVKLTSTPSCSTEEYPYRNIYPYLRRLIEAFGPRRCFWGTDLSAMLRDTSCTYRQAVTMFTRGNGFPVQRGPGTCDGPRTGRMPPVARSRKTRLKKVSSRLWCPCSGRPVSCRPESRLVAGDAAPAAARSCRTPRCSSSPIASPISTIVDGKGHCRCRRAAWSRRWSRSCAPAAAPGSPMAAARPTGRPSMPTTASRVPPDAPSYALRRVWLTDEEQDGYYYGFANEGLWPLCHIAFVRPNFREDGLEAIRADQRAIRRCRRRGGKHRRSDRAGPGLSFRAAAAHDPQAPAEGDHHHFLAYSLAQRGDLRHLPLDAKRSSTGCSAARSSAFTPSSTATISSTPSTASSRAASTASKSRRSRSAP